MQGFGVSCLSLPLFHASVGMEMFGDSGERVVGLVLQPPDRWVHHPPTAPPHAPVPCVTRNAQGSAAETARPKSALPEISLQSQVLLHLRVGQPQQHRGCCKNASWSSDKMWMTAAVSHVIVFCCSWLLGVLDLMPETCVLH